MMKSKDTSASSILYTVGLNTTTATEEASKKIIVVISYNNYSMGQKCNVNECREYYIIIIYYYYYYYYFKLLDH